MPRQFMVGVHCYGREVLINKDFILKVEVVYGVYNQPTRAVDCNNFS